MKKTLLAIGLSSLLAFAAPAMAQFNESNRSGGFTGPSASVATVAEALRMSDDTWVTLEGRIERRLGPETYQFSDGTGTVVIDIDDDIWRGLSVGPDDPVVITGEVDRGFRSIEIEVKKIFAK